MMPPTPKTVYVFANGMVAVFDKDGHQIPEYQGKMTDKLWAVLEPLRPNFDLFFADWERRYSVKIEEREWKERDQTVKL